MHGFLCGDKYIYLTMFFANNLMELMGIFFFWCHVPYNYFVVLANEKHSIIVLITKIAHNLVVFY